MRFNPVYLVLGLLAMIYAAPVDPGGDLGSHSNFEKPLRVRMEVDRKRIHAQFTGEYAEQNLSQQFPRPPAIVQELVHEGLAKLFPELTSDNEWMIEFGNEFVSNGWNPNTRGLRLTLNIHGIGECRYVWCMVDVWYTGIFWPRSEDFQLGAFRH
ncbi:MAG: hypothetical protein NXY57DRAFT_1039215 [Lentinula lateritia]|nr:MAG: hypothetical protein NXY57DRAFT_1039215 [Lentinula lateritia]